MTETEKYIKAENDLYSKLDKLSPHSLFADTVVKNKWQLLDILQEYAREVEMVQVNDEG